MTTNKLKTKIDSLKSYLDDSVREIDQLMWGLDEGKNELFIDLMDLKRILKQSHSVAERTGWTIDKFISVTNNINKPENETDSEHTVK